MHRARPLSVDARRSRCPAGRRCVGIARTCCVGCTRRFGCALRARWGSGPVGAAFSGAILMAELALPPGAVRRRAVFGLLDADGWAWAALKATFWFIFI